MNIKEKIKAIKFSRLSIEDKFIWGTMKQSHMLTTKNSLGVYHRYFVDKTCVLSYSDTSKALFIDRSWFSGKLFQLGSDALNDELREPISKIFSEHFDLPVSDTHISSLYDHNIKRKRKVVLA